MLIQKLTRKSKKLDARAKKGFYVGIGSNEPGARVWIPEENDVIVSSVVTRIPNEFYKNSNTRDIIHNQVVNLDILPDGQKEYEIEKILDERTFNGNTEFLIRWKGFTNDHDSWEPYDNIEDCEALDL